MDCYGSVFLLQLAALPVTDMRNIEMKGRNEARYYSGGNPHRGLCLVAVLSQVRTEQNGTEQSRNFSQIYGTKQKHLH